MRARIVAAALVIRASIVGIVVEVPAACTRPLS
jgi:hypothetical protein